MPLNGLAGKTVIVTGAAQGIGRAYARRFRDEGCNVVLVDVNADKGRSVLAEVTDSGANANISSAAYMLARPGYAHYMASKAGVLGLTRAMARELGEFNVRVNAITPGPVYTEIARATVTPEQKEAMLKMQCLKHHETPADLVGVAAFLASDDAAFITGQTIN